ncbi:MAG: SIS domain-containing protein [Bacteriovoracia bacterium]
MEISKEIERVLNLEAQALLDCARRFTQEPQRGQVEKAVRCLEESLTGGGKIILTGVGKSGKIAQKIAATLSSTGSLAVFLHPTEGLHGDLGVARAGDVVLALSNTGNTEEILRLLPSFRQLQIKVIGLGGNAKSKLAEKCDHWIDAAVTQEACPHNLAPTTSTTLAMAVGDAIAVTLMQLRGFDAAAFARTHPGGSLGRRLQLNVSDLMHTGPQVATVSPQATIEEVLVQSTEKKLGGVLVVEGGKLVGIVTDGDIRRALKHREKFFGLKATDVMTRNPITITPERSALDALEMMEGRASQISVLPVVDEQKNWKGLIRLHDVVGNS